MRGYLYVIFQKKSGNDMTTALELRIFPTTSSDTEPPTQQTRSDDGRLHQQLFIGGSISRCFQKAKECFSHLYGSPYPPLSNRDVVDKYCQTTLCLTGAVILGGLSTYMIVNEATNPSPGSLISPGVSIAAFSWFEMLSLGLAARGLAARGLAIMHKTCKAPRLEENQALLPPNLSQ
jgi:hypothetical protein